MLGKLIKYEFKATGRSLIPLYGALIVLALINKLFMGDFFNNNDTFLGVLPQVIGMLVYVGTMIAIVVVTLFIIIQRYRTNLLGDEGYLMNTIPVKPWQNILSKLIVALVWSIVSGIVAIISIMILAYQQGLVTMIITDIPRLFSEVYSLMGSNGIMFMIEILVLILMSAIWSILMIYAALSIGSLFHKRKILASFGAFIVLNIVTNTIVSIIQIPVMLGFNYKIESVNEFSLGQVHISLLLALVLIILSSIAYFSISGYILKRKLNLE